MLAVRAHQAASRQVTYSPFLVQRALCSGSWCAMASSTCTLSFSLFRLLKGMLSYCPASHGLSSLTAPRVPARTGLPCFTGAASRGDRGSAGSLTSGGLPVCTSYIFGDDQ